MGADQESRNIVYPYGKTCGQCIKIAKGLQNHTKLSWVKYPFLHGHPQYEIAKKQMSNGGGIVTFEVKGGIESGRKFLNALQMISMTNNLGDSRSIASHPASTTHSKLSEEERTGCWYYTGAYSDLCWVGTS